MTGHEIAKRLLIAGVVIFSSSSALAFPGLLLGLTAKVKGQSPALALQRSRK